jgi:hypothetical protein
MKIYAKKGEKVTCENGHHICTVSCDIITGVYQKAGDLMEWTQPKPKINGKIPKCKQCKGEFYVNNIFPYNPDQSSPKYQPGIHLHFENGWR